MGRAFSARPVTTYFFVQLINGLSHSAQRVFSRRSPSPSQGLPTVAFSSVVAPHLAPPHAASCARAMSSSSVVPIHLACHGMGGTGRLCVHLERYVPAPAPVSPSISCHRQEGESYATTVPHQVGCGHRQRWVSDIFQTYYKPMF
jgi:hypothetical protein